MYCEQYFVEIFEQNILILIYRHQLTVSRTLPIQLPISICDFTAPQLVGYDIHPEQ